MDKRLKMPDSILQVNLHFNIPDGDVAQNTFYLEDQTCGGMPVPQAWTDGVAAQAADHLVTAYKNNIATIMSSHAVNFDATWVWNEAVDVGPLHEGVRIGGDVGFAGGATGDPLPNGVSLCFRLQTGLGGRSRHGRFYLPLYAAGQTNTPDTNSVKDANRAGWATDLTNFLAAANGNTCVLGVGDSWRLVVESFVEHGSLRPVALRTAVTAINVSDWNLDFQRRRAPGHSRHG